MRKTQLQILKQKSLKNKGVNLISFSAKSKSISTLITTAELKLIFNKATCNIFLTKIFLQNE